MMTYDESLAITTELLRRYVDKTRAIRPEDHIQADLGLDSIAVMEFAADVEDRCKVDIPATEYQTLFTVADVARSIERLSQPAAKSA